MRHGKVKAATPPSLLRTPLVGTSVTIETKTQPGVWRVNKKYTNHPKRDGHVIRLAISPGYLVEACAV